jgi:hypothetical protein
MPQKPQRDENIGRKIMYKAYYSPGGAQYVHMFHAIKVTKYS